ncbi:MAG: ATP-binding protein [Acidimicrobiia bacterium]
MQLDQLFLGLIAAGLAVVIWRTRRRHQAFRAELGKALDAADDAETALIGSANALGADLRGARESSTRLERVLEASTVGVVIVDEDGRQVFTNPAAAGFTAGRGGDAVVGIRIKEMLEAVADSGEPQDQEIEVFTPSERTIMLKAMPLFDGDRRRGVAVFTDDLTPRSRIDEIRRDFVANASHELKTPLGALRLLAEALATTRDPAVQSSLNERIQSEASRMTRLVEDILDLSLIEAHQTVRGVVDISDVVAAAVEQVSLASEALAVPIEVKCESVEVLGDRRRLVSAVANLVENAVAYTSAKGIDGIEPVEVRGFRSGDHAHIEVEDRGIGIPQRHLGRIFERFYRVDKGRSRVRGGTGLGLAIVRHVVQTHWGEVTVESVPGQGSIFRIVLPARES